MSLATNQHTVTMRRLPAIIVISCLVGCSGQGTPSEPPSNEPEKTVNSRLNIELLPNAVKFGEDSTPFPARRPDLIAILGEPSRIETDGDDRILVWDQHAVYAFEGPDENVGFIAVTFYEAGYSFAPTSVFGGQIVVGDITLTPNTTAEALSASSLGSDDNSTFEMSIGDNQMIVEYNDGIEEVALGTPGHF